MDSVGFQKGMKNNCKESFQKYMLEYFKGYGILHRQKYIL